MGRARWLVALILLAVGCGGDSGSNTTGPAPVVIPEGLEEAWMAPVHGQQLRALEPLLAPWDPSGWEVVNKQSDGQLSLLSGLES